MANIAPDRFPGLAMFFKAANSSRLTIEICGTVILRNLILCHKFSHRLDILTLARSCPPLFWLALGALVGLLGSCTDHLSASNPPSRLPSSALPSDQPLQFKVFQRPDATIHTLYIPAASRYRVTLGIDNHLQTVNAYAQSHSAIAVLNGGFFDPTNGQSTSFVFFNGKLVADPRHSKGLTTNTDLAPFLPKIFNRSEWRQFKCQEQTLFKIDFHKELPPASCTLQASLGAGPQLLPKNTALQEGFIAYEQGKLIRDPLGISVRNARSALGLRPDGGMLWVMVAQTQPNTGMTLAELTEFLTRQGVTQALNLDGGSSSSIFYNGKTYSGKLSSEGKPVLRPVKSVLMLIPKT